MPIASDTLAQLAFAHAQGMTSIRGRRVQRLLRREFAGAEQVLQLQTAAGRPGVLGVSASGAAWCATDGRGPQATLLKWRHGAPEAVEERFDLLKDSLPLLGSRTVPVQHLRCGARLPDGQQPELPSESRAHILHALQMLA